MNAVIVLCLYVNCACMLERFDLCTILAAIFVPE